MSRYRTFLFAALVMSAPAAPLLAQEPPSQRSPDRTAPSRPTQGVQPALPRPLGDWARARAQRPAVSGAALLAEAEAQAMQQAEALDLADMPVEVAVQMIMALIAEVARDDLRDQAEEMLDHLAEKKMAREERSHRAQCPAGRPDGTRPPEGC